MEIESNTDYETPGVVLGLFSMALASLNGFQLWGDMRFPGRRGGGELQRAFHFGCMMAGAFDAISCFCAAYSVYGASMVVAVVCFDWMTMCGIFCVLKIVQLTVKNSFEVR